VTVVVCESDYRALKARHRASTDAAAVIVRLNQKTPQTGEGGPGARIVPPIGGEQGWRHNK
jgi:hypothetical protein